MNLNKSENINNDKISNLAHSKAWLALIKHYEKIKNNHMRDMFNEDANRFEKYSLKLNDILFDYSKNRINDETKRLLLNLAHDLDVPGWIRKMFNGEAINYTENRAVLHTALREQGNEQIIVDGKDIILEIKGERKRVKQLAEKVRTRKWRGVTNQSITDVVNIGIGGSHL